MSVFPTHPLSPESGSAEEPCKGKKIIKKRILLHTFFFQNLSKNIQSSLPPIPIVVVDAEEGAGKGAHFAESDEDAGIDDPYGWEEDAAVEQPHSRKGEQGCCGQVDDTEVHPRVCMPRAPARAEATAMMMRITVSHTDRDLPGLLSDVFMVTFFEGLKG